MHYPPWRQNPARRFESLIAALACLSALATATTAGEHVVTSADEIAEALRQAKPGDILVMADGEWRDQRITLDGGGRTDAPITLSAQTPGKVILAGDSSIDIPGDHFVVSGLYFSDSDTTNSAIDIRGSHNRVTETAIVAPSRGGKWVHFHGGERNRMDHCWLEGHAPKDVTVQVHVEQKPSHHRIDHNYFGPRPPLGANGGETIRIGYSHQQTLDSFTVVEHNLFDRCDGELEIISSKSCENIYRYNTFLHCAGTLTLRHGDRCTVDGNYFIGAPEGKSGGVRVIGAGHVVTNNYFENCSPQAGGVIALTCGIIDAPPTGYTQVKDALIAFNTMVNCGAPYIRMDAGYDPNRQRVLTPVGVTIAHNLWAAGVGGEVSAADPFIQARHTRRDDVRWIGNTYFGAEIGDLDPDARNVDPMLERAERGVWQPRDDSPVRDAAAGDLGDSATPLDIHGQPRSGVADVGCDELSAAPILNRPLQRGDVGPSWARNRQETH